LIKRFLFLFLVCYVLSLLGLNLLWYKHDSFTDFHWFDDLEEWQQMDKWGHFFATFHFSNLAYFVLSFSLFSKIQQNKQAHILLSGFIGFLLISSIEILDGFSKAYGASVYDLLANFAGFLLFCLQRWLFHRLIVRPKFSFYFTQFAAQRPQIFGDNWLTQLLKDYNGQTYWLSFPICFFPKWLHLAVGYSATEMLFGRVFQNNAVNFSPYRRFFISLDIDLLALKTRYKWLNYLAIPANLLRLPLPTLEWNEREGFVWHWLYF
jgi:VanZ family protein